MSVVCFVLAGVAACGTPLADEGLAAQRGGFSLPNGIDVALSIDTQTAVDGAVVLRSVFRVDTGKPETAVYVPRAGQVVPEGRGGTSVQVNGGTVAIPAGLVRAEAGTVTDNGVVTIGERGGVRTAGLSGAGLDITHLAGTAIGSAIANSANGRTIDTQTNVSIDLRGAGPDVLGSAMLQAQALASDAVAGRVR